jgi:hypothetical protein
MIIQKTNYVEKQQVLTRFELILHVQSAQSAHIFERKLLCRLFHEGKKFNEQNGHFTVFQLIQTADFIRLDRLLIWRYRGGLAYLWT